MLYSTVEETNKVLEQKKIEVRNNVLIPYAILRPRMYFINLWLLMLKAEQVRKAIQKVHGINVRSILEVTTQELRTDR